MKALIKTSCRLEHWTQRERQLFYAPPTNCIFVWLIFLPFITADMAGCYCRRYHHFFVCGSNSGDVLHSFSSAYSRTKQLNCHVSDKGLSQFEIVYFFSLCLCLSLSLSLVLFVCLMAVNRILWIWIRICSGRICAIKCKVSNFNKIFGQKVSWRSDAEHLMKCFKHWTNDNDYDMCLSSRSE